MTPIVFSVLYVSRDGVAHLVWCQGNSWKAEEPGFYSWQGKENFIFSAACRLAVEPTQPPLQWENYPKLYPQGKAAGAWS
jgi:hypothetical protein